SSLLSLRLFRWLRVLSLRRAGLSSLVVYFCGDSAPRALHSFPTRRSSDLSTHNLGTCRMSERPEDGVVDRFGRAHDVPNLFVSRSEEHTSELQSRENLVCRLLREKKKVEVTHLLHPVIQLSGRESLVGNRT